MGNKGNSVQAQGQGIKLALVVEASQGDLGEADVSKPKVDEVVTDKAGNVEKIIVKKAVIFQKKIEIPVERIETFVIPVGLLLWTSPSSRITMPSRKSFW